MDEEELKRKPPQKSRGGSINPAQNVANGAKAVEEVAQTGSKIAGVASKKLAEEAIQKTGKASARAAARSASAAKTAANLASVAAKAGKVAAVAAKIATLLWWLFLIIIIIMCAIGMIVFLITGMGLIMAGLKNVATGFFNACINVFVGEQENVGKQEIIDTLSYIEEMGYDLYGYGFTPKPDALTTEEDNQGNEVKGLGYRKSDEVYRYIYSYLVSDKYAYTIANNNRNFVKAFESWGTFFTGLFIDRNAWGSGMIHLYHENENLGLGYRGEEYGSRWWTWDELTSNIKVENDTLIINNPGIGTNSFSYSLDGWVGRYSMPLEFLLSTHLATMAPDLSYKMATSFDTQIEMLLHTSQDGDIDAAVQEQGNDQTRTIRSVLMELIGTEGWLQMIDNLFLTGEEILEIFHSDDSHIKIKSYEKTEDRIDDDDYECTGPPESENRSDADGDIRLCSDAGNTSGDVCAGCKKYVRLVCRALNDIAVDDLKTYIPYINKVTGHWYRNVYFTEAGFQLAIEENREQNDTIISTDDEFEKKTAERWTDYEMYEEDGNLQYELYVYFKNDRGEYSTTLSENVVCRPTEEGAGNYKISEDGITYVLTSGGNYKLQVKNGDTCSDYSETPDEFRVGKKVITQTFEQIKEEQGQPDDELWKAYETEEHEGNWELLEVTEESTQDLQTAVGLGLEFLYKADYKTVVQVEDGIRGQTNSKIKKLFLDDYYIFDGSGPRAALINKAKEMAGGSDDPDVFRNIYGDDEKIKITYNGERRSGEEDNAEVVGIEKEYEATIDEISGAIELNHSSLNAFSMLENMHTLDAEYIYHDFKELIVELNYFDKEDLAEVTDRVMMFPVAGKTADGWPVVRYDVSEEFYGNLIHSAGDYEALKAATIAELEELLGEEIEDEGGNDETNPENPPPEPGDTTEYSDSESLLVRAAADIMAHMQANDYAYCQGGNYHGSAASTAHPGRACYRAPSFTDSQEPGHNLIDCSGFISWCLQEVGIFDQGQLMSSSSAASLLAEYYTSGRKSSYSEYEPGTILCYSGHLSLYAGNGMFFDAGSTNSIMRSPRDISGWRPASSVVGYIVVPNELMTYDGVRGSSSTQPDFKGYEGGEPVLSPVTGEVIKYGTTERTNIETGETNVVGFIKVRLLGPTECAPGTTNYKFGRRELQVTASDAESANASGWLDDKYSGDTRNTVGYDYFWEEYNDAGIGDTVVYLEGFNVDDILSETSTETTIEANEGENITKLAEYIGSSGTPNGYSTTYTVPNLLDDIQEFKLDIAEQAKQDAAFVITKDGKVYIKEGAAIGKTFTQDDSRTTATVMLQDENEYTIGNYMRIILRDDKGEVIENVEAYMEKKDVTGALNPEEAIGDLEDLPPDAPQEERVRAAVGYFMSQGFTVEAACGIVGNLMQESGLRPEADNSGNYRGIAQWNVGGRWDKVKEWMLDNGYDDENSFAGQVRAIYECPDEYRQMSQSRWEELKGLTNTRKAAELFCVYYERCVGGSDETEWYDVGDLYQELNNRKNNAETALSIVNGG